MGVEKSEGPIPPFLSRAGSRVFSLSNMLRSNDLSHSHHDNSKAMSPLPVGLADSSPTPVGSPGGYLPLSRAASIKGAKLFGGGGGEVSVEMLRVYFDWPLQFILIDFPCFFSCFRTGRSILGQSACI